MNKAIRTYRAAKKVNNKVVQSVLKTFESAPEYYSVIIQPLLAEDRRQDLLIWLKFIGLIDKEQICNDCGLKMIWELRKKDLENVWKCESCGEEKSMTEGSVFSDVGCNLSEAIRILLGWCKGIDSGTLSNVLDINENSVKILYNKAFLLAKNSIVSNFSNWRLGGEGTVVVVDIYPQGCSNSRKTFRSRPILCFSELRSFPQKYWLEPLDFYNEKDCKEVETVQGQILELIKGVVWPGSVILLPFSLDLFPTDKMSFLSDLYPTILSVKDISKHDKNETLNSDLATLWKSVLDVCEKAQFYDGCDLGRYITSHIWRRKYGEDALQVLLELMSIHEK